MKPSMKNTAETVGNAMLVFRIFPCHTYGSLVFSMNGKIDRQQKGHDNIISSITVFSNILDKKNIIMVA